MTIPFELWGQRGWAGVEVAGESHYAKQLRQLFGNDFKGAGTEIEVTVQLVPEPGNKHDRNAVGVWTDRLQLGYLPRDEAARYVGVLSGLVNHGWAPQVKARVWGSQWPGDGFTGSVRLQLAEPHMLVPANMPPDGAHQMMPYGAAIQVTGEEKHLDDLTPFLCPAGECWAYATLHEVVEHLARSTREVVEVRLNGARVGQLTPKMSSEVLPAIRYLAEQGKSTGARAIVKGNRIKAEVVLHVARAHELPETWLGGALSDRRSAATPGAVLAEVVSVAAPAPPVATPIPTVGAVRDHGPIPPAPTGIRFAVPAAWPAPPAGWIPPAGWRPDPSWPVAPDGWQWWEPTWD